MVSVSILNIKDNINKIKEIDNIGCDYIHLDVMDGVFVSNKVDLLNLPKFKTSIDLHLMVHDVKEYIDKYKIYNPEYITFHYEAASNIDEIIDYIKLSGSKVGISIKPNTSVEELIPYLDKVDLVLIMSVEPGAGGQKFISNSENKINELCKLRNENNYKYLIEVDGGVNNITKDNCKSADILVVGSYITMSDDFISRLDSIND